MSYEKNLFNAKTPEYSAWISASAGTGKTKLLTDRVINFLINGIDPETILCLTFTKAARGEMLSRINETLLRWSQMPLDEIGAVLENIYGKKHTKAQIERAKNLYLENSTKSKKVRIYTIHAFCQNLLQRFPLEAGIKASFSVIDEREAKFILTKIISSNTFVITLPDKIREHCSIFSLYSILAESALNIQKNIFDETLISAEQIRKTYYDYFNLEHGEYNKVDLIKTLQLEVRDFFIKILNVPFPDEIIMDGIKPFIDLVEPSFRAAPLVGSVESSNEIYNSKSYSSIALSPVLNGSAINVNMDSTSAANGRSLNDNFYTPLYENFQKYFLTQIGEPRKTLVPRAIAKQFPEFFDYLLEIQNKVHQTHVRIHTEEIIEKSLLLFESGNKVLTEYQNYKIAHNILDYEDLITYACKLLSRSDMREWVKYKLDGGINHILVDESQDTSDRQWQIIQNLTDDFFSGAGSNPDTLRSIFVVGDVKQSIYSFQGARPDLFYLTKELTKEQCKNSNMNFLDIELHTTYRLPKAIYEFVDNVFRGSEKIEKLPELKCYRENDYSSVEVWEKTEVKEKETLFWPTPLELNQLEAPQLIHAKKIAVYIKKILDEKLYISSKKRSVEARDIMILVQSRTDLNHYLTEELSKLSVPVSGLDRILLNEHISIKDIISAGKFVLNSSDDFNLSSLLKSPYIGLNDNDLMIFSGKRNWCELVKQHYEKAFAKLERIRQIALDYSCEEFFMTLIFENNILEYYKHNSLFDYVDAIKAFVIEIHSILGRGKVNSLTDFINYFEGDNLEVKRDLSSSNEVRIMTAHGAKGLEAPVVILADSHVPPNPRGDTIHNAENDDNILPIWMSSANVIPSIESIKEKRKDDDYNEYIRLLYVALSRAQDKLVITGIDSNTKKDTWYLLCHRAAANYFIEDENRVLLYESGKILDSSEKPIHEKNIYKYKLSSFETLAKKPVLEKVKLNLKEDTGFGDTIHKILELYVLGVELNDAIESESSNLEAHEKAELTRILETATKNQYFKELLSYKHETEVEIGARINGKISILRIDLLIYTDDKIIIVDYKSDHNKNRRSEYETKLNQYKQAVELIHHDKLVECSLFWLRTNEWDHFL